MQKPFVSRFAFWKSSLRGWWLAVSALLAVWGLAGNFRSEFLTAQQQEQWAGRVLFPRWYWLVIAFLALTIIAILEGSFRAQREKVNELYNNHQKETDELDKQKREKVQKERAKRFKLFHLYREKLSALKEEMDAIKGSRVSIEFLADQPKFFTLTTVGRKDYRAFRVRVTNVGGSALYDLKAQIKVSNRHTSYENEDLTLMEEGLPIIRQILYRHERDALPKPRTSFSLRQGEQQFVNVAMQERENGKWGLVTLCLSRIGVDNSSNIINVGKQVEFSVVVLGDMPPSSKSFKLLLDEGGLLQMEAAD